MELSLPASDIWAEIVEALREELPDRTVKNWFESAEVGELTDTDPPTLLLSVSSSFHREHILDNYSSVLASKQQRVLSQEIDIQFEVSKEPKERSPQNSPSSSDSARMEAVDRERRRPARQASNTTNHAAKSRKESHGGVEAPSSPVVAQESSNSGTADVAAAGNSSAVPNENHLSSVRHRLKGRFSFDNFVPGESNAIAHDAASSVAENPGEAGFNPLLIYGGVGLGKTHLAQAIANYAIAQETGEFVCYISGESFTSEFVESIRDGKAQQFSRKYREVDLLILDDVQFFQGKEKTQEEFFHLFNTLHQRGKQIVLCADRPPQEIGGIERRLLSRFQWGLSAGIKKPNFETRLAILELHKDLLSLDLDQGVLEFLATNVTGNIRHLEGALKQLSARASLLGSEIDVSTARQILDDQIKSANSADPTPEDVIDAVTAFYNISRESLVGRSRRQDLVRPRHVAMYFCRRMTPLSLSDIGVHFAGRDHSTISHACKKIADLLDVEPEMEDELNQVKRKVQSCAMQE